MSQKDDINKQPTDKKLFKFLVNKEIKIKILKRFTIMAYHTGKCLDKKQ